jgi:DNA helicase HerA-like ATPase
LKVYRVRVRVPFEEGLGFAPKSGSIFFVLYHRLRDEFAVYLGSKVSAESLASGFEVEEVGSVPVRYEWSCEPRVRGDAFLEDPDVVDMHSFLAKLREGEGFAAWASRDQVLVDVLGRKLANLQEKSRRYGGRYDVLYHELRGKLEKPVYLLDVRVFAGSRERALELARLLMEHLPMDFGGVDYRVERGVGGFFEGPGGIPRFSLFGSGRDRLNMTEEKLQEFLVVPNPNLIPVGVARGAPLPDTPPLRRGFRVGTTPTGKPVFLDPEDFERHAYIIGSTGSGKTNLLRVLVDGLRRSDPESVIVVLDPHGDLAPSVAAKYEGSVYFHPTRSPFTMNPLRLPSFGEAEQAKLLGISNLMEIFEKVFWLGESAVYVRYILQNAMHALYSMTAEPTFTDLYRMILLLRNGEIDASWLAGASGAEVSAVKEKVEFFKNLNSNSFVSALSRLELLATNGVLRKVFGGQDVSDDIFMKPGSTVCVDTGITDVGDEASYLIMAGFMMKVWYLALAGWSSGRKANIYMVIDEFHRIADLSQVDVMLSEARKYGLHLIMAHQHTGQLTKQALESVFSNTGVKFVMHSQGGDVEKLKSVDRDFQKELETVVPNLPKGAAVVFLSPRGPKDRVAPFVVNVDSKRDMEEAGRGLRVTMMNREVGEAAAHPNWPTVGGAPAGKAESVKPGAGPVVRVAAKDAAPPIAGAVKYRPDDWVSPLEQDLLYEAYRCGSDGIALVDYCTSRAILRDRASEASKALAERGYVKVVLKDRKKTVYYIDGLFTGIEKVAPSKEGLDAAKRVMERYIAADYYVYPSVRGGEEEAPDLIAVPKRESDGGLDWASAVAIEIESTNEVDKHPDQVVWNMKKGSTSLFREIHVYVPPKRLSRVAELARKAEAGSKVHIYPYPAHDGGEPLYWGEEGEPAGGEALREVVRLEGINDSVRFRLNGRNVLVPVEAVDILEQAACLKQHTPVIDWRKGEVKVSSRIGGFSIRFTVDDSPLETPLGLAGSGAGGSAEKAPADDGDGEADDMNGNNGTYGEEAEGGHDDNQVEEGQGGGRGRGEAESPPETEGRTNGEAEPGAEKQRQAEEAADRGAVGETGSERAPVSAGANGFSGQAGKLISVTLNGYSAVVDVGGYTGSPVDIIPSLINGRIEGSTIMAADGKRYPIIRLRKKREA